MDKLKLIKLLNLSSSLNDSEALSAIRKTEIFLKENNTNWSELLENSNISELKSDYAVLHMNLLKERSNFYDIEEKLRFSKRIIKYLLIIIAILIIINYINI